MSFTLSELPQATSPAPSGSPEQVRRRLGKLESLLEVVKAMTAERNLDELLPLIIREATRMLDCERCSLFILDRERGELWSRVAQGVGDREIRLPMGQGLAGAVAASGEVINLPDAYDDARFSREWDARNHFRTRSVLCVPMRDTKGTVTGVLQALNARAGIFTIDDEGLLAALGGQAAQAIENAMLHEDIARLFEGFVQASVTAIESRDPSTAGHSDRVATLTVALAEAAERAPLPEHGLVRFSREQVQEIRYASLLHDFGKIGVREAVLVKAQKLFPQELALLTQRFELARRDRQLASARRRLARLRAEGLALADTIDRAEDELLAAELRELDEVLTFVLRCNEPTVLPEGNFDKLATLDAYTFRDAHEVEHHLLTHEELRVLRIPKGSLSEIERREIEAHVTFTWRFLAQIPWTRALRGVPAIAYAHHEKLNGVGYPRSLPAEQIPIQSRMMAIADIYDALTAADRPYKRAVPHERALDILTAEAKAGQLDRPLLELFIGAEIPRHVLRGRPRHG